jgi:NADPH:quinone reductase-like Zn-dependent oxidoreductase
MRVALARKLDGIDSVELGELPDPEPAAEQALVRVHGAGVGLWDVGFLGGGFPGIALPFVPGQEIAGVAEAAGEGAGVQPGVRVYAVLFPAGVGRSEAVRECLSRLDGSLYDLCTIHGRRDPQAVPVNHCGLGQPVREFDL